MTSARYCFLAVFAFCRLGRRTSTRATRARYRSCFLPLGDSLGESLGAGLVELGESSHSANHSEQDCHLGEPVRGAQSEDTIGDGPLFDCGAASFFADWPQYVKTVVWYPRKCDRESIIS